MIQARTSNFILQKRQTMKRLSLLLTVLFLSTLSYAQLGSAAGVGAAAKAGALSEVMEDSMKDKSLIDTTAVHNPAGDKGTKRSNFVLFTSAGVLVAVVVALAARRRRKAVGQS